MVRYWALEIDVGIEPALRHAQRQSDAEQRHCIRFCRFENERDWSTFKIIIAECQRLKLASSRDIRNESCQPILAEKQCF